MRHVVAAAAAALSCEFGVLYLPTEGRVTFDDHSIHNVDRAEVVAALDVLGRSMSGAICVQNADEIPFPLPVPLRIERIDLPELDIAVGHATNRGHESIEATVAAADTRMYAAKAAAKDSHGR